MFALTLAVINIGFIIYFFQESLPKVSVIKNSLCVPATTCNEKIPCASYRPKEQNPYNFRKHGIWLTLFRFSTFNLLMVSLEKVCFRLYFLKSTVPLSNNSILCRFGKTKGSGSCIFPVFVSLFRIGVHFDLFDPFAFQFQRCSARQDVAVYRSSYGLISRRLSAQGSTGKRKTNRFSGKRIHH